MSDFLEQQQSQNAEVAATLTLLELPNLFALLDLVQAAGDAEATIGLTTSLYSLLQMPASRGCWRAWGRRATPRRPPLGDAWNHARFEAARTRIEQQLAGGRLREAFDGAQALLQRARAAGEQAYPGADYDLAMAAASWPGVADGRRLGTGVAAAGRGPPALRGRGQGRVPTKPRNGWRPSASRNKATVFSSWAGSTKRRRPTKRASAATSNSVTTGMSPWAKASLGPSACISAATGRRWRRMPKRASGSRQLDEPGTVAVSWHQTGMAYQQAGQPEAAEDAYRKSLAIKVRLGDVAGQASTLVQLGNLYDDVLDRPEEAVAFYRQAADKYVEIGDAANEGRTRNNLADTPAQAPPPGRSAAGNPPGDRMQSAVRPRGSTVEVLGHPRRHRDGRRQRDRRRGGEEQGHRLLPRLPPRRRREPLAIRAACLCRDPETPCGRPG